MIELLATLNGDNAASVPDFLFFTQQGQINYIQTQGPPRTEKPPKPGSTKPKPPARSNAEITLSKALNRVQKGENVPIIEKWAEVLDLIVFSDLTAAQRDCSIDKITKNVDTSINTCKNSGGSSASGGSSGGSGGKKGSRGKRKRDMGTDEIRYRDIEEEVKEFLEDFENDGDDENYGNEKENESFEDEEEHFRGRFRRDLKRNPHPYIHQPESEPRSIVQTLDMSRMRRGLSFTYSNYGQCYTEGSKGATSDTVRLCQTCYNTIDFGENV